MTHLFPSPAWAAAYRESLNASATYRDAASTWRHGAIALVVLPEPRVGLPGGYAVWLDVEGGRCHDARSVTPEEAQAAPFCITASYARWRQVLARRLDPIAGMVTRQLLLKGDLLTMMRYVRSAAAMVACAAAVPAHFADDAPRADAALEATP